MPKINAAGIVTDATLDEDPDFAQPVDEPTEVDEPEEDPKGSDKPAPKTRISRK